MTENFSASQTVGIPNTIILTDSSTGIFDPAITDRKVYITDVAGNYITANGSFTVPTSTDWPVADLTVSIACLDNDMALQIRVDWLDVTDVVLYTKTILFDFEMYGLMGSFQLTQALSSKPNTIQDANYWNNRIILTVNLDDANNAVTVGNNQFISQSALDRATYMLANQQLYF